MKKGKERETERKERERKKKEKLNLHLSASKWPNQSRPSQREIKKDRGQKGERLQKR